MKNHYMKKSIIEVRGISIGYDDVVLLENLSFDVFQEEILMIVGISGCGKSTLLKHLIGLQRPLRGDIRIAGESIVSEAGELESRVLRRFGVMYQQGALFSSMSALANVRLPLEELTNLPTEAIDMISRLKLRLVNLDGYEDYMPEQLSGGMRKRVAIARALATDPQILFLDEPSAGLDPVTASELDELILTLSKSLGITFVIVSHELASIFKIAERIIMLDRGERGIIAQGTVWELSQSSGNDPRVQNFLQRKMGL